MPDIDVWHPSLNCAVHDDHDPDRRVGKTMGASRVIRPYGLTSRDAEAEVLERLAHKGYDWSRTPGTRRRAS